jgi:cell division protein FtsI (penicillin-binding protein 3)
MKPVSEKWLRFRSVLLVGLFALAFLIVWGRAYQLQVLQSHKLANLAERQQQRVVPLVPKRGILYDRKREELAISVDVDSVFAQPGKIENLAEAAKKIGPILGKKPDLLLKKLKEEKPFIWLERGISPEQRLAIEKFNIEGVDFLKEAKRFYPQREVGSQVVGFAGLDSQGLEGVELGYDEFIKGEPGYILIAKDALGRPISPEAPGIRQSQDGCEVVLTLDRNIQYVAEKELKKAVQASSAKGGMMVIMNPKTGEILAMAGQPSFDPNRFKAYPAHLLKNRNITDTFEPGSTFKLFLLAAALEEGVTSPRDVIFCENGTYAIGGRVIHDVHKYGWLSLGEVIKVSSNIGAAKVGKKLGRGRYHHYLKSFGFGGKTGIDLPGEVSGFLPAPQHWSEVGLANISFGQGVSLTLLQLTNALSVIANDGLLMRPYVVKAVLDAEGNILKENRPRVLRRVISPETARTVAQMMKTVTEEGGTGRAGSVPGYDVAGKTGTAQKASATGRGYSDKRIGSFIGFAPAGNPQVAIAVVIDEPEGVRYGGVVAAPAFRAVAEQILPYLGAYPQGTTYLVAESKEKTAPVFQSESRPPVAGPQSAGADSVDAPGVMPDFSGKSIRQVVQTAQRLGLELKFVGSGKAVAQNPPPGQILQGEIRGTVRFQPSL